MTLTVKEKEEYVLKLCEEGKTYRDIAHCFSYPQEK